jgi:hypothetical protein
LAAAIVAGAQILGGMAATGIRKLFRRRTSALLPAEVLSAGSLVLVGLVHSFWAVIALIVVWGLLFAAVMPIRQVGGTARRTRSRRDRPTSGERRLFRRVAVAARGRGNPKEDG